jgi:hypothetical protein
LHLKTLLNRIEAAQIETAGPANGLISSPA